MKRLFLHARITTLSLVFVAVLTCTVAVQTTGAAQPNERAEVPPEQAVLVDMLTSDDWERQQEAHKAYMAIPDTARAFDLKAAYKGHLLSRVQKHGRMVRQGKALPNAELEGLRLEVVAEVYEVEQPRSTSGLIASLNVHHGPWKARAIGHVGPRTLPGLLEVVESPDTPLQHVDWSLKAVRDMIFIWGTASFHEEELIRISNAAKAWIGMHSSDRLARNKDRIYKSYQTGPAFWSFMHAVEVAYLLREFDPAPFDYAILLAAGRDGGLGKSGLIKVEEQNEVRRKMFDLLSGGPIGWYLWPLLC